MTSKAMLDWQGNNGLADGATVAGLDIGSAYATLAVLDCDGRLVHHEYRPHHGRVFETVRELVAALPGFHVVRLAKTGDGAVQVESAGPLLDPAVALLTGARHIDGAVRNIIYIGAGSFHLIVLNERGEYLKHTANTACASGTGAFLDQQALRLGTTPEQLPALAAKAGSCPSVATRCAVFAKTDIIHLQGAGHAKEDIAAGICRGMAESTLDVLLKGKEITGRTLVVGGVARNGAVVQSLTAKLGFPVQVPEFPELTGAIGAAVFAAAEGLALAPDWQPRPADSARASRRLRRPALRLEKSSYPTFAWFDAWTNADGSEIAVVREPRASHYAAVLGLDIGSTSTKAVVATPDREPLLTVYRKTGGDPIRATQLLLKAVREAAAKYRLTFDFRGVGTTGSGRKLICKLIRADLEMNEITAHARAAVQLDPAVDTILEIGGQDAKFTQLEDGAVYNSVMNYVCAAGTGSFIEEQAKRLGLALEEYGDAVLGVAPPRTSDRCTVFMERDLGVLLAQGWSRQEVAAAVLYSVCENYLNKVVAGQHIGERVYFQGATARNKALIAAFEQTLGKPILVSPLCHLTGALGMALLLLDQGLTTSTFRGLDFADTAVTTAAERCTRCRNACDLTVIDVAGEKVGWGLKCGKEYHAAHRASDRNPRYDLFVQRHRLLHACSGTDPETPKFTVGLPNSLIAYGYLPLWGTFLRQLGGKLVLSRPTDDTTRKLGLQYTQADFCAPVIIGHGHVAELAAQPLDFIFMPHQIRVRPGDQFSDTHFCPFVQSHPAVVKATHLTASRGARIVAPVIPYAAGSPELGDRLHEALGALTGASLAQIRAALTVGLHAQNEFRRQLKALGREALAQLKAANEMGIVIFGRPYNVNDPGLNVGLAAKIAKMGVTVIPLDCLEEGELEDRWYNMYWNYGQAIVRIARTVLDADNLFGVMFSNFCCGPDSYLMTYFKEIMHERHKPFLIVQFDAHGADAGYVTRAEAALESFRAWRPAPRQAPLPVKASCEIDRDRIIFFPPMDPLGTRFFAAAFAGEGYRAEVLREDEETLDIGYKHTLGGECVPCPSTLGSFIKTVEERGLQPHQVALFMPLAHGPCRFGQYACLDHLIFRKKGWSDVQIVSPSAENSYSGLSDRLRRQLWKSVVINDLLWKMTLKIRPHETTPGRTNAVLDETAARFHDAFRAGGRDLEDVLAAAVAQFQAVPVDRRRKPRVGVVGEIYVRNNVFINQNAIDRIESYGGEALKSSIAEWVFYSAYLREFRARQKSWNPVERAKSLLERFYFATTERQLYRVADPLIHDRHEPSIDDVIAAGRRYVPPEFEGEAILTIGRALVFIEREKVDAVVNLSPSFCMPGTITTSILARIEDEYGVPIICLFYDGSGDPNLSLRPHLHCLSRKLQAAAAATAPAIPTAVRG